MTSCVTFPVMTKENELAEPCACSSASLASAMSFVVTPVSESDASVSIPFDAHSSAVSFVVTSVSVEHVDATVMFFEENRICMRKK